MVTNVFIKEENQRNYDKIEKNANQTDNRKCLDFNSYLHKTYLRSTYSTKTTTKNKLRTMEKNGKHNKFLLLTKSYYNVFNLILRATETESIQISCKTT